MNLQEQYKRLFKARVGATDKKILREKFDEYINSPTKTFNVVEQAWEKLNSTFSFKVVKNQLEKLYG